MAPYIVRDGSLDVTRTSLGEWDGTDLGDDGVDALCDEEHCGSYCGVSREGSSV